jgi:hypothetical protein
MDAWLLQAVARGHLGADAPGVQALWVGPRALALQWQPRRRQGEGRAPLWVFLLNPAPELWRLEDSDEAWKLLKAEARPDETRRWGLELKGARLVEVQGDPRERTLGLIFQRRALSGRMEVTRLLFRALPGRAGLRLDALDIAGTRANSGGVRLGLGQAFPPELPGPEGEPLAFTRFRERWGDQTEAAWQGAVPDVLPGEGSLGDRHRAWSLERAARILLAPKRQQVDRKLVQERKRLERLRGALADDAERHRKALGLKERAGALAAELYRLKGVTGRAVLLDGTEVELPQGWSAERTAQAWFAAAKKAERGLARVADLEREWMRQWRDLEARLGTPAEAAPAPAKEPRPMTAKAPQPARDDRRQDGKGKAFRSLMIDQFEVLIGKGDADNDRLTFKVATGADFWLHVANVPGSHVIIRNPDKVSEPPRDVLERAAQLAAWHSKAREAGKVEVHWCRVADVSKPRGFAPGKVILKTFKSVRVYPKE